MSSWFETCNQCEILINEEDYQSVYGLLKDCPSEKTTQRVDFYLGICCYNLRKIDEAISHYKKLDFPLAHYNLATCYGIKHDLPNFFREFECRFKVNDTFSMYHDRFRNHWDGKKKGNTIYVYNEQGIGDMVQYMRFLPMLKKFFKKIIVECAEEMNGLFTEQYCDIIVTRGKQPPIPSFDFDCAVSIGSLPYKFKITKDKIPNKPYIFSREINSPGLKIRKFPQQTDKLKIGVCWKGNPTYKNNKHRSCDVKHLLELKNEDRVLYNLTKDVKDDIVSYNFSTLQETANLISEMDVVVSVDTAVAHIAGAMGIPTILLLGKQHDWRWGIDDETTYWYPKTRIMRLNGDWSLAKNSLREFHKQA
jgi:hypothetical protein